VPDRFKPVHPSHREGFLEKPAERPMGADRELFGLRADGSEVPIEISLNPIHTGEGNFVLAAIVDITERIHAQRLVQAKQAQLERTNRELDEFAHVVSHDLKAPLRGVISLSTWIAEDCAALLPKESHEHLKLLTQRTRRMSELIDGILHYSLAGRASSPAEPVEVSELVRDVIDSLAPPPSIRVRVEAPLPIVHYDRTQLRQVFQNLLANAIQHSGDRQRSGIRSGPGPRVPTSDDKSGSRSIRFNASSGPSPDAPTGGIGLAIVKKIVERNGGSAGVVSQPGAGASFRFSVPKASMGAETRLRRRRPPTEKSGEERTDHARRG
jgi:light-regulated signal transduction histidine kinase (bacteriophytochrome)